MKRSLFTFGVIIFTSIFSTAQTTLPTSCDFSGMQLPSEGWTANSPSYYTGSGNPAPAFKFGSTGKYLLINVASTPGIMTFDLVGNSVQSPNSLFKVQESADNSTYSDVVAYSTELNGMNSYTQQSVTLNPETRFIKFIYVLKGSPNGGNVGLDNVVINAGQVNHQEIAVHVFDSVIGNNSTVYTGASVDSSAVMPFILENTGLVDDLEVYSIDISGTNASEFSLINTSFPDIIAATTLLNVGIKFSPTVSGPRTATVTILSNDLDFPSFSFNIIGFGGNFEVEPTEQPTQLTFEDIKTYRFKCNFTGSDADGYLILQKKDSPITEVPLDGQVYNSGDIIGSAKVVRSSASTFFIPREIVAQTTFYFAIFAYNGTGQFTNYLTTNPLTGSQLTPQSMVPSQEYASINTSSPTLINDLYELISPHIKNTYDSFKDKLIEKFYERDTTNGKKVLTCLYTGEMYIYDAPFSHNGVGITREHTFAYSWFPNSDKSASSYSDYHNLFPIHQNRANAVRSNYPFGIVTYDTLQVFGKAILGRNSKGQIVYEPKDTHKGDVARALFYMSTRYTEDGVIWKIPTKISSSIPYGQDQTILKKWNIEDPPDGLEIARNDFIDSLQENRNPFIDFPEYACFIDFHDMTHHVKGCDDLGFSEESLLQSFITYPNPTSNTITISVDGTTIIEYRIFDITGNLIKKEVVNNIIAKTIDVSSFSSGTYIIDVATELGNVSKKVVIE